MVNHIVLYKLKENTAENRKNLIKTFESMRGKIPALVSITAGEDFLKTERSFDVALVCTFESLEKLLEYQGHPNHLPVKQYVKSVVERSHSVDFLV